MALTDIERGAIFNIVALLGTQHGVVLFQIFNAFEDFAVDTAVQGLAHQLVSERRGRDTCCGEESGEILELVRSIDLRYRAMSDQKRFAGSIRISSLVVDAMPRWCIFVVSMMMWVSCEMQVNEAKHGEEEEDGTAHRLHCGNGRFRCDVWLSRTEV